MNYFKYHVNKPIGKVWSLFSDLYEVNKMIDRERSISYGHSVDIINSALSGSIRTDDFNLAAYEYKCDINEKNLRFKRVENELFIVDEFGDTDDSQKVGFGDISVRKLGTKDNSYDEIVDDETFNTCFNSLLGMRNRVIVDYGIDIILALRESLDGVNEAMNLVKIITNQEKDLEVVVTSLCSSSQGNNLYEKLNACA